MTSGGIGPVARQELGKVINPDHESMRLVPSVAAVVLRRGFNFAASALQAARAYASKRRGLRSPASAASRILALISSRVIASLVRILAQARSNTEAQSATSSGLNDANTVVSLSAQRLSHLFVVEFRPWNGGKEAALRGRFEQESAERDPMGWGLCKWEARRSEGSVITADLRSRWRGTPGGSVDQASSNFQRKTRPDHRSRSKGSIPLAPRSNFR